MVASGEGIFAVAVGARNYDGCGRICCDVAAVPPRTHDDIPAYSASLPPGSGVAAYEVFRSLCSQPRNLCFLSNIFLAPSRSFEISSKRDFVNHGTRCGTHPYFSLYLPSPPQ